MSYRSNALIVKKFEEIKLQNPRYSQRAFAQRLGLSSGALSEILKGKRILSSQLKKKIASKLLLSPLEQVDFFSEELPDYLRQKKLEYHKISTDQYRLVSDWWHFAILNLINTKNFSSSAISIADRLNISLEQAQEAWQRLIRLGFLKKEGKKYVRGAARLETSDDLFDLSIQKSHISDLKLIENSILNVPIHLRDHTSVTFVMDKNKIKKAKELIRIFQDQFTDSVETNTELKQGEEVYKISIGLFPLTKVDVRKE